MSKRYETLHMIDQGRVTWQHRGDGVGYRQWHDINTTTPVTSRVHALRPEWYARLPRGWRAVQFVDGSYAGNIGEVALTTAGEAELDRLHDLDWARRDADSGGW